MRSQAFSRAVSYSLWSLHFAIAPYSVAATDSAQDAHSLIEAEIVVTARKREEGLMDVPVSVTAFSESQLQSPLISDISSVGALAPNVDFNWTAPLAGSSNAASVFIRGIGQNDFLLTTDPGVGIYLDGVYISRSVGGVLGLMDVERVEVLRGPQGTLFGKNSIGGAVQVVTRAPSETFGGSVGVTLGDFNRRDVSFSVEGALDDNMQARFSLVTEQQDGYVTRVLDGKKLGDTNRRTAKAVIAYQPDEATNIQLAIDHTWQDQESIAQSLLEVVQTPGVDLFNLFVADPAAPYDERWVTGDPFTTYQTGPSQDDLEINGLALNIEHDFETVLFTSITGYRTLNAVYSRDPDGSPYVYAEGTNWDDHSQFSQEFRFQGGSDHLDWQVGLYYLREHGINRTDVNIYEGLYDALVAANNPLAVFFDTHFSVNNDQITTSAAAYSQVTWFVTDALNVTAGVRFTHEEKEFGINNYSALTGLQIQGPATVNENWDDVSPMLSVDYHWSTALMTYASISRGFKSGGFNGRQIFPLPLDDFEPEYATTVELGLKRQWGAGISARASVFNTAYDDMQFSALLDVGGALLPVTNNAAEATIKGLEVEVSLADLNGLSANVGVGYLHGEYNSLDAEALVAIGSEDVDLIRVPRWNVSVDVAYRWAIEQGAIRVAANTSYKSKVYNDPANIDSIAQGGYTLFNASVDWITPAEKWKVGGFVTNLGDKRYLVTGATALGSTGFSEAHYGKPREWGARVTYQF